MVILPLVLMPLALRDALAAIRDAVVQLGWPLPKTAGAMGPELSTTPPPMSEIVTEPAEATEARPPANANARRVFVMMEHRPFVSTSGNSIAASHVGSCRSGCPHR